MAQAWEIASGLANEIVETLAKCGEKAPRGKMFAFSGIRCKRSSGCSNLRFQAFVNEGSLAPPSWATHLVFEDGRGRTPGFLLALVAGGIAWSLWEDGLEEWTLPCPDRLTYAFRWRADGALARLRVENARLGIAEYKAVSAAMRERYWAQFEIDWLYPRTAKANFPDVLELDSPLLPEEIPWEIDFSRRNTELLMASQITQIAGLVRNFACRM